jgi:PucR C-terminal helix-turn-helix domain
MTRTNLAPAEPWRQLEPAVAEVIEPETEAITEEILATIAREVPEYARPLEGSFGRGVRVGVSEALRQFVALVREPDAGREPGREVYVALGRGELRQGRTLDSLQAAYRVGARVAWRRIAAAGREAGLDVEELSILAEAIFAYIDELSADSVEGFAQAQAEREGERRRRTRDLVALLVRDPPADDADVRASAQAAGWRLPRVVAPLACPESELDGLERRLPADVIVATLDGVACALIPDPDGPGRSRELERVAGDSTVVLGPSGDRASLAESWSLALAGLRAAREGALGPGLVRAEDHLVDLLLLGSRSLCARIAARRLAPFDALTPRARQRMEETAVAYVRERGNAPAMARAMHVHPQTARYRLARLRELLGEALDEHEIRLELELALRFRGLVL